MSRLEKKSQDGIIYLYDSSRGTDLSAAAEERRRLRRYIRALRASHRKQVDALLAQLRQSGRQIAELRMEAGLAASAETRPHLPGAAKLSRSANSKPSQFAHLGGAARQRQSRLRPAIGPNARGRKTLQRNKQGTRK